MIGSLAYKVNSNRPGSQGAAKVMSVDAEPAMPWSKSDMPSAGVGPSVKIIPFSGAEAAGFPLSALFAPKGVAWINQTARPFRFMGDLTDSRVVVPGRTGSQTTQRYRNLLGGEKAGLLTMVCYGAGRDSRD